MSPCLVLFIQHFYTKQLFTETELHTFSCAFFPPYADSNVQAAGGLCCASGPELGPHSGAGIH